MQLNLRRVALIGVVAVAAMTGGCANQSGDQFQLGGVTGNASSSLSTTPDGNPLATKVLASLAVERITGKKARFIAAERPAGQGNLLLASN